MGTKRLRDLASVLVDRSYLLPSCEGDYMRMLTRREVERVGLAITCQYEVVAIVLGKKIEEITGIRLPSITRYVSDSATKHAVVVAALTYHFHRNRKTV